MEKGELVPLVSLGHFCSGRKWILKRYILAHFQLPMLACENLMQRPSQATCFPGCSALWGAEAGAWKGHCWGTSFPALKGWLMDLASQESGRSWQQQGESALAAGEGSKLGHKMGEDKLHVCGCWCPETTVSSRCLLCLLW